MYEQRLQVYNLVTGLYLYLGLVRFIGIKGFKLKIIVCDHCGKFSLFYKQMENASTGGGNKVVTILTCSCTSASTKSKSLTGKNTAMNLKILLNE